MRRSPPRASHHIAQTQRTDRTHASGWGGRAEGIVLEYSRSMGGRAGAATSKRTHKTSDSANRYQPSTAGWPDNVPMNAHAAAALAIACMCMRVYARGGAGTSRSGRTAASRRAAGSSRAAQAMRACRPARASSTCRGTDRCPAADVCPSRSMRTSRCSATRANFMRRSAAAAVSGDGRGATAQAMLRRAARASVRDMTRCE